jgi:hypothetical protein
MHMSASIGIGKASPGATLTNIINVSPQMVIPCDTFIDTYGRIFAFCRKFLFLNHPTSGQVHL